MWKHSHPESFILTNCQDANFKSMETRHVEDYDNIHFELINLNNMTFPSFKHRILCTVNVTNLNYN